MTVFFSPKLSILNLKSCEVEQGQVLIVTVDFIFVNVCATNHGFDCLRMFWKLNDLLKEFDSSLVFIVGGDWNCTLNSELDRIGEEPHPHSADMLLTLAREHNFMHIWRENMKR